MGRHGNVFIPKTEQGVWSLYDGDGKKLDIDWADFSDIFGMLGIKCEVQKKCVRKKYGTLKMRVESRIFI